MRKGDARVAKKQVPKQTLATTTPLVQELFDNMFEGQMDDKALKSAKKQRCGICEVCRSFCKVFLCVFCSPQYNTTHQNVYILQNDVSM